MAGTTIALSSSASNLAVARAGRTVDILPRKPTPVKRIESRMETAPGQMVGSAPLKILGRALDAYRQNMLPGRHRTGLIIETYA